MKLKEIKTYNAEYKTCGELVDILEKSGGNPNCCDFEYFTELNNIEEIHKISLSWAWIECQKRNKKLIILNYPNFEYILEE